MYAVGALFATKNVENRGKTASAKKCAFSSHAVAVRNRVRRRRRVAVAFFFIYFSRIEYFKPGLLRISLRLSWWPLIVCKSYNRCLVSPNVWYTLRKILKMKFDGIPGRTRYYQLRYNLIVFIHSQ